MGNAEHGCIAHKTKALLLLASPTPELQMYMQAAQDLRDANDAPLASCHGAVLQTMLPALSRVLAVAPPRCAPAALALLGLEEYVREACDELLRQSPVLSELRSRHELHLERATISADGEISLV